MAHVRQLGFLAFALPEQGGLTVCGGLVRLVASLLPMEVDALIVVVTPGVFFRRASWLERLQRRAGFQQPDHRLYRLRRHRLLGAIHCEVFSGQ